MNVRFTNSKDYFCWVLTNVYTPNSKWGRKALWTEISNQRNFFEEDNWIVIGDFNAPLKENEKWGGSQTLLDSRIDLLEFIDQHTLHDIDLYGVEYT